MAILGTGWLGLPLAGKLVEDQAVHATYRTSSNRKEIVAAGAVPHLVDLPVDAAALPALLENVAVLIVTLPPGGRRHGAATTAHYLNTLAPLRPFLADLHLIYTSSTGVYGKEATGIVTEDSPLAPDSHSSRAVAAAEAFFLRNANKCTILRLGGLYGPGRDPVRFFRRVEAIPDGDAPVNMVHLDEVLEAMRFIVKSGTTGIFNVCSAQHPTKRDFYGSLYAAAGLPPKKVLSGGSSGKRIDSLKLRRLGWLCP